MHRSRYNDDRGSQRGGNPRGGGDRGSRGGGAEHLARIHGTEEDRVNCPFYFKIGACRHGDRCARVHNKPVFSQTILIHHMYQNPVADLMGQVDQAALEAEFEDFYEEMYEELGSHGHLEEMLICENVGEHLVGNIYVKYTDEEDAAKAQKSLYGRFYDGRVLICEFSPVTDFREAKCRQHDDGSCRRGGYCNFIHTKQVSKSVFREFQSLYNPSPKERAKRLRLEQEGGENGEEESSNHSETESSSSKSRHHYRRSRHASRSNSPSPSSRHHSRHRSSRRRHRSSSRESSRSKMRKEY